MLTGDSKTTAEAVAGKSQVGIAMGTGTDVAMESAGVTLVRGDLRGILKARRLSRATMTNIKQNLFFSLICNALRVSFSSVSVIGNALRLRAPRL